MNNFAYLIAAATSTPTTTPGKTSSGSPAIFLVLIILFAGFYFGVMRPNQKRRMQAMRQARAFDLGDEVVAGGMVGRVVRMGDGTVDIEVSDGVIVQFVPNAVQLRSAYMAGPGARGLGAAGRPGLGTGASTAGGPSATAPAAPVRGRRNVSRRAGTSDAWPGDADSPAGDESGFAAGGIADGDVTDTGTGDDGGVAPNGGDR
jgi:preprotein translocase subunit YajC